MSELIRRQRLRALAVMAGLAGVLVAAGLGLAVFERPAAVATERMGQPVIALDRGLKEVERIDVALADESYSLVRTDEDWRMDTSTGFPVRPDRARALLVGLRELSWGEARTRDPRKFDTLGLGDPRKGGSGALVTLKNRSGEALARLIAGRRDERLYARRPDEPAAWRVEGELPPLHGRDTWMDFAVLSMQPETIGAVLIAPAAGEQLLLVREPGEGPRAFEPGPAHPDERLVSPLAASTPALALSRFAPIDVKPAAELQTAPVARHVTITHDGLEVEAKAYREPDGRYVTLRAIEAGEGAARAEAINRRAAGWAFELTRYDWAEYTPSIAAIVERAIVPQPAGE